VAVEMDLSGGIGWIAAGQVPQSKIEGDLSELRSPLWPRQKISMACIRAKAREGNYLWR